MFKLDGEHVCSYSAGLTAPPEIIGPVPEGIRATFYITGGEISGPKLRGKVRSVGADWGLMRHDGVFELDVRATLETHDGALIYTHYRGLGDMGPDGYAKFLEGKLPPRMALRTTPTFRTSAPQYQWMHRLLCVGIGEADLQKFVVSYDVYALR